MKLNCVVVDDDELDNLTVVSFIQKHEILNLVKSYSSSEEALREIQTSEVDVLFLDIDMPQISGLELARRLLDIPVCIFITSFPEHAVEGFELDALDFIVKPIKADRFAQTISRIESYISLREKAANFERSIDSKIIFIKEGNHQVKLNVKDVLYLEALKDYTLIITSEKRHCVLGGLGAFLRMEEFQSFRRVHRSFAVQRQSIVEIGVNELVLFNQKKIPVGRSYKGIIQSMCE
jgi:two-component system, LytTR family, response regulator